MISTKRFLVVFTLLGVTGCSSDVSQSLPNAHLSFVTISAEVDGNFWNGVDDGDLYLHYISDDRIWVLRRDTRESAWINNKECEVEITRVKDRKGTIVFTYPGDRQPDGLSVLRSLMLSHSISTQVLFDEHPYLAKAGSQIHNQ